MTKRLIESGIIIIGLVGFSSILIEHFYPGLTASYFPESQWFYLGGALILAVGLPTIVRDIFTQSSKILSIIFILFVALSITAYSNLFLLIRLYNERRQATLETRTITQDYRIQPKTQQPLNIEQAQFIPAGSLYQLSFNYPKAMYLNEDGEVTLSNIYLSPDILKALKPTLNAPLEPEVGGLSENLRRSLQAQSIDATVELVSHSFSIEPSGPIMFPLVGGTTVGFVISPQQIGTRRILVRSKLNPAFSKDLEKIARFDHDDVTLAISVLPERTIIGLSGPQLQQIQLVTSSVGLPALLIAAITIWRDSRKDRTNSRGGIKKKAKK